MPNTTSSGGGRNALLEDIQKGRKLKKAVTNDRSAPIIATTGGGNASSHRRGRSSSTSGIGGSNNPPVGLGGLFAGGVPTLKSRGGGVDTGRGSNGLAIPPPLGGRPRATSANPTGRSSTSSTKMPALPPRGANQNSSSKATGKSLNSSGPPALPNRSTPSVPSSSAPTLPVRSNPPLPPRVTKPVPPPASKKPTISAANSTKKTTTSQSPSPQPRQILSVIDKQRPLTAVLPTNGNKTLSVKRPLSPSKSAFTPQEPPTTEGRWTFHPSSDFPKPRPVPNTEKVYPSGASTGSSIPLDLSFPQRAPPPPPLGSRTNGRK